MQLVYRKRLPVLWVRPWLWWSWPLRRWRQRLEVSRGWGYASSWTAGTPHYSQSSYHRSGPHNADLGCNKKNTVKSLIVNNHELWTMINIIIMMIIIIIISSTVILVADWSIAVGYWIVFHCFSLNGNARIRISVLSPLSKFYPTSPWQLWVWPQVYTGHSLVLNPWRRKIKWRTFLFTLPPDGFFWRLKHYLRMLVCKHGVYMKIKMAESK